MTPVLETTITVAVTLFCAMRMGMRYETTAARVATDRPDSVAITPATLLPASAA